MRKNILILFGFIFCASMIGAPVSAIDANVLPDLNTPLNTPLKEPVVYGQMTPSLSGSCPACLNTNKVMPINPVEGVVYGSKQGLQIDKLDRVNNVSKFKDIESASAMSKKEISNVNYSKDVNYLTDGLKEGNGYVKIKQDKYDAVKNSKLVTKDGINFYSVQQAKTVSNASKKKNK